MPMKKITVILQVKDAQEAVKKLRKLGVVHIEEQQEPKGRDISLLTEDLDLISQAVEVLEDAEFATGCEAGLKQNDFTDWRLTCRHIMDIWKRRDQLEEYSRGLLFKIEEWKDWGDFDPENIRQLAQKGIFIKLCQVPVREMKNLPDQAVAREIFVKSKIAYCAVISGKQLDIGFKEFELPKIGISQMQKRLTENRKVIESLKDEFCSFYCQLPRLSRIKAGMEKELEYYRVLDGMGEAGALAYLAGFIPYDSEADLRRMVNTEQWGLVVSDPSQDDFVPTLIRNSKFISMIAPVFKLIEIIPGYKELDISLPFLIFLSIFFGMLIGDAGYGALYFGLTIFANWKWGKKIKEKSVFFLFYVLSFCAIIWGLLTGVFFGQAWLVAVGWKPLLPMLQDTKNVQAFCFFLGALHLSIAHSWKAALKFPSLTALAEIGWIFVLWAAFFLARSLILGDAFPLFVKWLLLAGASLVIFFTSPQKNILKAIGSGLSAVALNLMNNFTDVVSYVRLFAVGLAGVAIADAFNSMAAGVGRDGILNLLLALIIIIAGHALNLMLGPMSVLVHGIRLNVLEFCGHVGINWSGRAYKPFKED
ncbi:MAG: hypothetical protein KKA59_05900 [Candidatus Omnitrophica bacterium]|nr:hypothetical protein [Candidatus Omnitrophota bacterium]